MSRNLILFGAVFLGAISLSTASVAQDTPPRRPTARPPANVLQIGEITIVGRVQKPIAAVDVAKLQPKLTLSELTKTFVDRIAAAVNKDPF